MSWLAILRFGLVQTALGSIVVMATSTLNRVMVVEASLPAVVPGLLVGLHYAVQVTRPRLGYGSDVGGRRTPWIVGGMAVLALGCTLAAIGTALMADRPVLGIALATVAFLLIGLGVGAAGTSLLVLLAASVDERRRAAAAGIVWIMMIAGFVVTATSAGILLDPYSPLRLVQVTAGVCAAAFLVACAAVWRLETGVPQPAPSPSEPAVPFRQALAEVWTEPAARRFAMFVFVSMLAYSAQDLVLEPFAGAVFGLSPGATTRLSGLQHGGVLTGMLLVAAAGTLFAGRALGSMRNWAFGGCLASAVAVVALAATAVLGEGAPLLPVVFANGVANGAFAIAAIGAMMQLVSAGRSSREGVRMGLWGGAQAVAFGLGGFLGAAVTDIGRLAAGASGLAYAAVFLVQAILFLWAAQLAAGVFAGGASSADEGIPDGAALGSLRG